MKKPCENGTVSELGTLITSTGQGISVTEHCHKENIVSHKTISMQLRQVVLLSPEENFIP